jgi:hypothetical protein
MGRLRPGVWRRLAYMPRFTRHYWHRSRWGAKRALSGTRRRMREYDDDSDGDDEPPLDARSQ